MGILKTEAANFLEKINDMTHEIAPDEKATRYEKGEKIVTKYVIGFAIFSIE